MKTLKLLIKMSYFCKNAASTKLSCRRHYSQLTAVSCQSFCLLAVFPRADHLPVCLSHSGRSRVINQSFCPPPLLGPYIKVTGQ